MKNFFICLISFFVSMSYFSLVSYGQQNRSQAITQTQQSQPQQRPPAVPQASSAPASSPYIATQPVSGSITLQSQIASQGATSTNIQTLPTQPVAMPYGPSGGDLSQMLVPVFGNSWGKVLDIGRDKNGVDWVELDDELFNSGKLKMKLKDPNTAIIKNNSLMKFSDIKIGDTVNIVYRQQEEENIANFIGIITEEDLKAMSEGMLGAENEDVDQQNNIASSIHIFTEQELEAMKQTAESEGLVTIEEDVEPIFQLEEETDFKEEKQTIQPSKKEPQKTQQPKEKRGFFDRWLDRTRNK